MRTSWVIGAAIVIVALHMLGVLDTVAVFVLKAGAVLAVAVLAWIILARPRRAHSRTPGLDRLAHSHRILRRRGHLDREHGKREPGYAVPVSRLRPPPPGMHHVIEVVDGDTIRVDWDGITETLRLIGVDAPETKHPDKPVEYFGPEASEKAKRLLRGQIVRLEFDQSVGERDDYGRLLAYVWLPDGRLLNLEMIWQGCAKEFTYNGTSYKYRDCFQKAETEAQRHGRGLWAEDQDGRGWYLTPGHGRSPQS